MVKKEIIQFALSLIISPLLFGVINRTKAFFAGRRGAPLLQLYYDLFKLLRKSAVYSDTITPVFVFAPIISLGAVITSLLIVPFAGYRPLVSFEGDLVLFIYLLALARFFIVIAALDTGSSFEGMGASREAQFAVFAEPAFFLSLVALSRAAGQMSVSGIFSSSVTSMWSSYGPMVFLVLGSLFIVFLAENSRIPVDDPNTHLELTMIHEVMVLDHSGVDLAFLFYSAAIKFWLFGSLIIGVFFGPRNFGWGIDCIIFIVSMMVLACITGIVESIFARLRLLKVPHFLIVALALSVVAVILTLR
ncbi:MAG: NADH-quinone oxidoreductase subunit H [Candidatus Omnitrophica bacterium]|jgi:formate hydrogenlyase subunit 4|nr:NADH-quinone oxidoreductase subunit H [Candidatus Omnitrophota bacterium]